MERNSYKEDKGFRCIWKYILKKKKLKIFMMAILFDILNFLAIFIMDILIKCILIKKSVYGWKNETRGENKVDTMITSTYKQIVNEIKYKLYANTQNLYKPDIVATQPNWYIIWKLINRQPLYIANGIP